MKKPTGRPRGRPRKPRPVRPPRHAPLPFQAEHDVLVTYLRAERLAGTTSEQASPVTTLVAAAGAPVAPLATAILGPFQRSLRIELTNEQQAAALEYLRQRKRHNVNGLAPNSRRGMTADWLNWLAYCLKNDCPALPTNFGDLHVFIDQLVDAQRQKATIEHHLWSITRINRRFGCPDPMASEVATDYLRHLLRERLSGEQKQAEALSLRMIKRMTGALADPDCGLPVRRHAEQDRAVVEEAQRRRRLRDIAMINVAYDLLTRASELVNIRWDRIAHGTSGNGTYRMGKTKTDQGGFGHTRYMRPATMAALSAWQMTCGLSPFVFHAVHERNADKEMAPVPEDLTDAAARERVACWPPFTTREVGVVFRRAAVVAGVSEPKFSGHSTRVGATVDLIKAGGTIEEAQQAGGWKNPRMVMRYAAKPLAERAGHDRFVKIERMLDDD